MWCELHCKDASSAAIAFDISWEQVCNALCGQLIDELSRGSAPINKSCPDTRRQQPIRIGLWYTANGLGIAGGGLLGYAIGHIHGKLASWKVTRMSAEFVASLTCPV